MLRFLAASILSAALLAQAPVPAPRVPVGAAAPSAQEHAEAPVVGRSDPGPGTSVWVAVGEKRVRLESLPGTLGRTWAYFATLFWADFPGLRAELRLQDTLPVFFVDMEQTPRHRLFLVRCRSNSGDRNRSVKMGQAGAFTYKGLQAPDPDWVIPVDISLVRPGHWRLVPTRSLAPGEYGLLSGAAAAHATKGSPVGELFEFGVDRP